MWKQIEIQNVSQFQKDKKAAFINDYVKVTLEMPIKVWGSLKKLIETHYIHNKRKHDNRDGSFSINMIFEKVLDISKLLNSNWSLECTSDQMHCRLYIIPKEGKTDIFHGNLETVFTQLKTKLDELQTKRQIVDGSCSNAER